MGNRKHRERSPKQFSTLSVAQACPRTTAGFVLDQLPKPIKARQPWSQKFALAVKLLGERRIGVWERYRVASEFA